MCEFNKETLQCEMDNRHHMDESRKSFPSGHAGLAFGSMTVMTVFFLGKEVYNEMCTPEQRLF
jgi:membrane-associated PAP2 superfamily phosphatase